MRFNTVSRLAEELKGASSNAVLARGALGAFTVNVTGSLLSIGVHILLARGIGVNGYGIYVYVITWCSLLVLLGKMGLDTAILRFGAAYRAQGKWDLLRGLLSRSKQLSMIASATVGAALYATVWEIKGRVDPDLAMGFLIGSLLLPLFALTDLNVGSLRSLLRSVAAQLPIAVIRPLLIMAGFFVCALLYSGGVDGPAAIAIHVIAQAMVLIVTFVLVRAYIPKEITRVQAEFRSREWLRVALPLMFITAMGVMLNYTDTVMVGALLGPSDAGIYSAASRLAMMILFALNAVNVISGPMISTLYTKKASQELQNLVIRIAWGVLAFALPVALTLIIGGAWILGVFGNEFVTAHTTLSILAMAQLVNAMAGPVGYLMTMTGHQRQAAWVLGGSVLLNITLNAAMIPAVGIVGAAVATALVTVTWNLSMVYLIRKNVGINMLAFLYPLGFSVKPVKGNL